MIGDRVAAAGGSRTGLLQGHAGIRAAQSCIYGQVTLAGSQSNGAALAGAGVGVAVLGAVRALQSRAERVVGRRHELHDVRARGQAGEQVLPARVRGGAHRLPTHEHRLTAAVQQVHRHAGKAGLTIVADAVGIGVVPDRVAQGGRADRRRHEPEVLAGNILAGGNRHGQGAGGFQRLSLLRRAH